MNENSNEINNDEICIRSNKSCQSPLSKDTLTEQSNSTKIDKIQVQREKLVQLIKQLTQRQKQQDEYIEKLKNSMISLAEADDSLEEYKNTKELASTLQNNKKRKVTKEKEKVKEKTKHTTSNNKINSSAQENSYSCSLKKGENEMVHKSHKEQIAKNKTSGDDE